MENVVSKRCKHAGCKTHPCYGHPGGQAKYCKTHALGGMENAVSKRCEHAGCKTQPCYDHPGGRRQYCKAHAREGMEDVMNEREGMVRGGGP